MPSAAHPEGSPYPSNPVLKLGSGQRTNLLARRPLRPIRNQHSAIRNLHLPSPSRSPRSAFCVVGGWEAAESSVPRGGGIVSRFHRLAEDFLRPFQRGGDLAARGVEFLFFRRQFFGSIGALHGGRQLEDDAGSGQRGGDVRADVLLADLLDEARVDHDPTV